jgi:hypothetical protein
VTRVSSLILKRREASPPRPSSLTVDGLRDSRFAAAVVTGGMVYAILAGLGPSPSTMALGCSSESDVEAWITQFSLAMANSRNEPPPRSPSTIALRCYRDRRHGLRNSRWLWLTRVMSLLLAHRRRLPCAAWPRPRPSGTWTPTLPPKGTKPHQHTRGWSVRDCYTEATAAAMLMI